MKFEPVSHTRNESSGSTGGGNASGVSAFWIHWLSSSNFRAAFIDKKRSASCNRLNISDDAPARETAPVRIKRVDRSAAILDLRVALRWLRKKKRCRRIAGDGRILPDHD